MPAALDLTGAVYGKLTVLTREGKDKWGSACWLCQCECGNKHIATTRNLRTRDTTSCGCKGKVKIDVGQKYGFLTIIEKMPQQRHQAIRYLCECVCGTKFSTTKSNITAHHTRSCGCKQHKVGSDHAAWKGVDTMPGRYWGNVQRGAASRGLKVEVTKEEAYEIFTGYCELTGDPISFADGTASLDRIDSTRGYVADNVQWVHRLINTMKWSYPQDLFIEMCRKVAHHAGDV